MAVVSWSNVDYFTRNIGTVLSGSTLSTATVDELLAHICASNGPELPWPTAADVLEWTEADGHPSVTGADVSRPQALEMATAAAVTRIARLKGLPVRPVDSDGAVDPDGEPVTVDADVFLATVMLAARLYDRREIPDGPDKTGRPWGHFSEIDADIAYLLEEPPSL